MRSEQHSGKGPFSYDPRVTSGFRTGVGPSSRGPAKPWVNIVLFLCTIITTMYAGAVQSGAEPFRSLSDLFRGIPFSAALLGILLAHEMGHYLTSRYYGVSASLPYFIPVPTLAGTMGAIIRMRSVIRDRRILFDIGIAGPLAGMVVAVPVAIIGLHQSSVVELTSVEGGITLGDSLLFLGLTDMIFGPIPAGQTVLLHPVALAGWLGFFITSLNLIPISQLDGGHVAYGVLGPRHANVARFAFLCLLFWGVHGAFASFDPVQWMWAAAFCIAGVRIALARYSWRGLRIVMALLLVVGIVGAYVQSTLIWLFWATLMTFLRLDHPPTRDVHIPLDSTRKFLALLALVIFIVTFIPRPFQLDIG